MADITIPGTSIKLPPWALLMGVGGVAAVLLLKGAPEQEQEQADYTGLILSETDQRLRELVLYLQDLITGSGVGTSTDPASDPASDPHDKPPSIYGSPRFPGQIKCFRAPCPGFPDDPVFPSKTKEPDSSTGTAYLGPPVVIEEMSAAGGITFGSIDYGVDDEIMAVSPYGFKTPGAKIPGKPCTNCIENANIIEPGRAATAKTFALQAAPRVWF